MPLHRLALPAALAATLLLAACGGSTTAEDATVPAAVSDAVDDAAAEAATEALIEQTTGADVDVEDGGNSISGVDEQGRAFSSRHGEAARLPGDFPGDVVVPEGLVFDSVNTMGANVIIGGRWTGRIEALSAELTQAMAEQGWTSSLAMQEPTLATQIWVKDARSVNYQIEGEAGAPLDVVIALYAEPEVASPAAAD